jgi:branched-chain amino acid transport system substrate-binding protein
MSQKIFYVLPSLWYYMKSRALFAVVLLIAGVILCGCTGLPSGTKSKDVVIGVLVPLTGDWSSKGQNFNAAIALAAEDTNADLATTGSGKKVRLVVEDTGTDPLVAAEKIKKLQQEGARIVVGPASSEEIASVKDWADQHGVIIIGYGSTAPALSVPGDNVFRLVPDDRRQAEAMARYLDRSGVRVIIPVVRNDTWGKGLLNATKTLFEQNGGVVLNGYLFGPGTRDFSLVLTDLSAQVTAAQQKYGNNSVGVYAIGFDEMVPLLSGASGYPPLAAVPWFGSDGAAKSDSLTKNASAARFAEITGFYSPVYGEEDESGEFQDVKDRIQAMTGSAPDPYSLAAYDATVIAARSLLNSEDASYDQLKKAVELTAGNYYGVTGWTKLIGSGDRAYAVYGFWTVRSINGTPTWVHVARFQGNPGQPGHFT